jgi:ArsR family transcriptional regulator, arsenate/arsenite/antimonite-responsive transcriptional repressor
MDIDDERMLTLEQQIASLQERVATLEAARDIPSLLLASSVPAADFSTLYLMQSRQGGLYEQDGNSGAVIYAGAACIAGTQCGWQIERPVPALLQLLSGEPELLSQIFAALGNPFRLTVLRELLSGPKTSQQIQEAVGISSAGQLYHHLKELLAAGIIEQKSRNLYALPLSNVIPFLALLTAAFDTVGKN